MMRTQAIREWTEALADQLRGAAEEGERRRRVPNDVIDTLRTAGVFRLLQPRRFGGQEMGFDSLVELGIGLGRYCGSSGWLAVVLNTGWLLAAFPEEAQNEIWRDSADVLAACAFAPTIDTEVVPGGYRISGRWPFCSGIHYAEFVIVGGLVRRTGGLDYRMFVLPKSDYRVEDDWYTVGLRGTGSASLTAIAVFIPEHRTIALGDLREGTGPGVNVNTNPVYRIPFGLVFPLSLASPVVGMAAGALESWKTWMQDRRFHGLQKAVEYHPVQAQLAEAAAEIDCAEMLLRRDATEAMQLANSECQPSPAQRARSWRDGAYAAQLSMRAVDRLFNVSGGAAIYDRNPLQRAWRDVHAALAHVSLRWDEAAERFGRDSFGLKPNNQFFF